MARILFILKLRETYGCNYGDGLSSGLFNSARLVVEMLQAAGVESKLVQVVDNNDIDREVHQYKPTHVVIEGLWVVPEKFEVLHRLHPRVEWIVRIHSEIPFLAMEGVAMDWIAKYTRYPAVTVACNSRRAFRDIRNYLREVGTRFDKHIAFLPNYYPVRRPWWPKQSGELRVGCFGAIRPLKSQLIQAMAAIEWATRQHRRLTFFMTHRDCEQGGDQVLRNLRALFAHTGHTLKLLPWLTHDEFLVLMEMLDVGMQVSLSETFNIVAADMVSAGLPVVVSAEISWASVAAMADPTSAESIINALDRVTNPLSRQIISGLNRLGLERYSADSRTIWLKYLAR